MLRYGNENTNWTKEEVNDELQDSGFDISEKREVWRTSLNVTGNELGVQYG
jgi:hypothetical protein